MQQRTRKKSVLQLSSNLTGRFGPRVQAIAIRQVRQWIEEIPEGDSICMRCESVLADKQFRVWKQWFRKHEDSRWNISDDHRSFFFYKSRVLQ